MSTFSKRILSGSTNGRPILVVAVATLGTTIHTAVAGANDIDEVWLYAVNADAVDRKLTIEFGGAVDPGDTIEVTIAAESGLSLVIPGLCLQNSLVVTAFAAAANVVCISGYVNRITA